MTGMLKRLFKGWDDLATKLTMDVFSVGLSLAILSALSRIAALPAIRQRFGFQIGKYEILGFTNLLLEAWLFFSLLIVVVNHGRERLKRAKAKNNGQ